MTGTRAVNVLSSLWAMRLLTSLGNAVTDILRTRTQGVQTPRKRRLEIAARKEKAGQVVFHAVVEMRSFQELQVRLYHSTVS